MEKTWRCLVCGYLHQGDQPPASCPVCHADASQFVLVAEPAAASEPAAQNLLEEMLATFVPHAVSAHFPNALLPTTVLFLGLFVLFGGASLETSAFYLLLVSAVTVPLTLGTGLYDWKKHYRGELAPIFRKKIILASLLLVLGSIAALWRWQNPQLLHTGGPASWLFLLLILLMLGCVTLLGHYGGMLVFANKERR